MGFQVRKLRPDYTNVIPAWWAGWNPGWFLVRLVCGSTLKDCDQLTEQYKSGSYVTTFIWDLSETTEVKCHVVTIGVTTIQAATVYYYHEILHVQARHWHPVTDNDNLGPFLMTTAGISCVVPRECIMFSFPKTSRFVSLHPRNSSSWVSMLKHADKLLGVILDYDLSWNKQIKPLVLFLLMVSNSKKNTEMCSCLLFCLHLGQPIFTCPALIHSYPSCTTNLVCFCN